MMAQGSATFIYFTQPLAAPVYIKNIYDGTNKRVNPKTAAFPPEYGNEFEI